MALDQSPDKPELGPDLYEGIAEAVVRKMNGEPGKRPSARPRVASPGPLRLLKIAGLALSMSLAIGAVIWSAAVLVTAKVDETELRNVEAEINGRHTEVVKRVEAIEKNDVRQTVILERIDGRLDRALNRRAEREGDDR